jgi:hypothetical protein
MSKAAERDEDKIRKGIAQAEYVKKGKTPHPASVNVGRDQTVQS